MLAQQNPDLHDPDRQIYLVDARRGELNLAFTEHLFSQVRMAYLFHRFGLNSALSFSGLVRFT